MNEDRVETLAIDTSLAQAFSFASEAASDEIDTIEASAEESRTSRIEEFNTNTQTFETSFDEFSVNHRVSIKRSRNLLKRSRRSQQQRRNADNCHEHI